MCGITGFARHPDAPGIDEAWSIFEMMMLQIRHRGTHATGIAVQQGKESFIWKKAAPVDKVLNSDPWKTVGQRVKDDATVVQGHVRFATHNNAHLDEAAHPFVEGKITGCHNGIIRNWQEIAKKLKRDDMINDSQVPFAMLNEHKNPAKALDTMDGYWALTWTKGNSLFLCKTNDAVLACAYVPAMRTLFWNSESRILNATLKEAGIKKFEMWDVRASTIYRYTPAEFTEEGTNASKVDAPFRGRNVRTNEKFDSAHSTVTSWKGSNTSNVSVTQYHGQRSFQGGSSWDGINARENEPRVNPRRELSGGELTLKNIVAKFEDISDDLQRQIDALKGDLEVATAEVEFLRAVADEAGLLEIQTVDVEEIDETDPVCPACLKPFEDSQNVSDVADGGECGLVHTKCLFTEGHVEANKTARLVKQIDANLDARRANGEVVDATSTVA